jgi:peptidoglycan-associated lipoprotein
MRVSKLIKHFSLLTIMAVSLGAASAQAPNSGHTKLAAASAARPELALDFTYLRSNAPPGGCTCFNLYGGSATFAYPINKGPFALVGDITAAQNGSISSNGFGLTLSTYTVGARYEPKLHILLLHPFGQALVGVAHSSGSLVQGAGTSVSNASAAFAANVGGGVDLATSRRIWVRAIQAEYLPTTFDNGSNNHQNNLRISAGIVIRF